MYHFFVDKSQIGKDRITITGSDYNHIKNVLRMPKGEEVSVSDGESDDEYRCRVADYTDDSVILDVEFIKKSDVELPAKVYLFQGLPKADKMELIIQKCVELGIYEIVPVTMARSVVKLDGKKAASKVARWNEISRAAAKQSKRAVVPQVSDVISYKEALKKAEELDIVLVPYEMCEETTSKEAFIEASKAKSVGIFIGPEGGFDKTEIDKAMEMGGRNVTLGRRILRTETAGMVALSYLNFLMEIMA